MAVDGKREGWCCQRALLGDGQNLDPGGTDSGLADTP